MRGVIRKVLVFSIRIRAHFVKREAALQTASRPCLHPHLLPSRRQATGNLVFHPAARSGSLADG